MFRLITTMRRGSAADLAEVSAAARDTRSGEEPMSLERSTQAADTVARLQDAERSGVPVMIPGAREPRIDPVAPIEVIADPAAAWARAAEVLNRIRFEPPASHEPRRGRTRTMLARFWRRVYRGPDAALVPIVK